MNVRMGTWMVLFILLMPFTGIAQVEITQDITQNTRWTGGNVYWVKANVKVSAGATLTIEPGAVVKFNNFYHGIVIEGTLNAVGTPANPVVFTSYQNDAYGGDTNGDGNASQPARGNWAGLDFQPGSSGQIRYARLTYGGGHIPLIRTYVDNLSVTNSVVSESQSYGISVIDASPDIAHNTFSGVSNQGIRIDGFSSNKSFELSNNVFQNNQGGAVWASLDDEVVDVTLTGNSSTGGPYGGFRMAGTIAGQVTYTGQDDFPFILGNTVTVNAGAALVMPFGTTVKADNFYYLLDVYGRFDAQGSPQAPVVFTSYFDDPRGGDTNGDGDATAPAPGNWSGIRFNAGAQGTLEWCQIAYAGGSLGSNVAVETDAVTIRNSDILFSRGAGLGIRDASPLVEFNLFGFNNSRGIFINGFSPQTFRLNGNDFQSNGLLAVDAVLSEETNDIILTGNTYSGGTADVFRLSGSVTGQVTYQGQADFAFLVDETTLSVEPQARLDLTPGTVIKFREFYSRVIVKEGAQLYAEGTVTDSIALTSIFNDDYAGDANNDGTASLPAKGNWGGIDFQAGSSGALRYCHISYGGGFIPALQTYSSDVVLANSYIGYSRLEGVKIYDASPDINDNIIEQSNSQGVRIEGFSTTKDFLFTNNILSNNGGGAVLAILDEEVVNVTLGGNTTAGGPNTGFGLQGSIAGQVTYTGQDDFPFILRNTVTVQSGATLDVPFGTTFKAENFYFLLDVYGTFRAQGAPQAPVVFTSYFDDSRGGDTNGDGDATAPAPGNWSGIRFNSGARGMLDWCQVSYAGGSLNSNIVISTDDVSIRNTDVLYSRIHGIAITDASPDIENNLIGFNANRGITVDGFAAAKTFALRGNDFQENGQWAVYATLTDETNDLIVENNTVSSGQHRGFGIVGTIAGTVQYSGQRNFPFLITEATLRVQPGASLTIDAGTTVKFTSFFARMEIEGDFYSLGSSTAPVYYTSYFDDVLGGDTNGDGDATSPTPGNWGGILYQPGSAGRMQYSCLNFGAGHGNELLYIGSDEVTIDHVAVGNTSERGITIDGAGPTITKTIVHQNVVGIYTLNGADPVLENSEFLDNRDWGLYNADGTAQVFAINNWWGSASGPDHPTNASGGQGDKVSDQVVFEPWLDHVSGQDLIPIPVIGLTPYGRSVALSNDSYVGSGFSWDFGDGTGSNLMNPYHTYAEPGDYEIKLIGTSLCHVVMTQNVVVGIKGIKSFSPTTGGNTGTVTVEVAGGGFSQHTQVALVQAGGAQLPAQDIIIQDGENLIATFNTDMQPLGEWNILITYAGGSQVLSDTPFTLEQGRKGDPWLQVSGRSTFLFNTWQTFQVTYGNRGNVDLYGVNLWLALSDLPELEVELLNVDLTLNDYAIDQGYDFITDVDPWVLSATLDGEPTPVRALPLYIPLIPAGEEYTIKLRVRSKQPYSLDAWLNSPYFNSPFNGRLAACVSSVIAEAIFDAVPGVDCAKTVIKSIYKPQNAYRPGSMKVLAMPGMWDLVSIGVDCGMELTGAFGFAKDMIGLALNLRQYKADIDDCVRNYDRKDPKHQDVIIVQSFDPNEKVGPVGIAAENYLPYQEEMRYTIYFENKDSATAPAHRVVVRDTLDATRFDLNSIELEEVVIADSVFTAFTRSATYAQQIELPHLNVVVRITGEVDTNGVLIWEFISLDPVTLEEVLDPFVGFLPPNQTSPEGEGHVQFSIRLKEAPQDGQLVQNKASIFFDANEPIKTNTFANRFDLQPPSTFVSLAEAETTDTLLQLQLNGSDERSGIVYYQIWYAEGMDTFSLLGETSQDTFTFAAEPGMEYHFYSIGVDEVGNREAPPASPDASVNVVVSSQELESPVAYLTLEPNPADQFVTVQFQSRQAGPVTIELINAYGQLVRQRVVDGRYNTPALERIRVADLPAGVYMLGVRQGSRTAFRRLVIQ